MQVLNKIFATHVISRRGNNEWPARSPDLNTCDFFSWRYLKSKVYKMKTRTKMDLKQNIKHKVATISPTMLQ
jgi:hypothetical protein